MEVATDRAKGRLRIRSMGTSGRGLGHSRSTSRVPTMAPPASCRAPSSLDEVRVITSTPLITRPKVRALSRALIPSNLRSARGFDGRESRARTSAASPTGMLTANSQGQGPTARIAEATLGPTAAAAETTMAFTPMPRPSRRLG